MNRILLSLVVLFMLCACTYGPEEIYKKEIPVPENPTVRISLSLYDSATVIPVYGPTYFQYDYSSEFGSFEKLEVFVNENLVYTTTAATGSIPFIDDDLLVTGQCTLKLQTTAKTNTGSLADKLNAEKYIASRSWTLDIMVDPPEPPVLSIAVVDGFLKVSWTKFSKPNFFEYFLIREAPHSYRTFDIYDPNENFFIDKEFMGGQKIQFNLTTNTYSQYAVAVSPVSYEDTFTVTGNFDPTDSTVSIQWSKPKLYGPFKNYTIQERYNFYGSGNSIISVTNLNDTTIQFKPGDITFNSPLIYTLLTNSDPLSGPSGEFDVDLTTLFKKLPVVPYLYTYNATTNSIYGTAHSGYYGFDLFQFTPNLELTDNFYSLYPCAIPSSGNFFFTISNDGSHLVEKDLTTRQPLDSIKLSTFAPGGVFQYPSVLAAANNQMVAFTFTAGVATGSMVPHVLVYDMANNLLIYHESYQSSLSISGDGTYLYLPGNTGYIYKIENNTTTLLHTISPGGGYLAFNKQTNTELYTLYFDQVFVYDVEQGALKRTIQPPNTDYQFRGFDQIRNRALYLKSNTRISYAVDCFTQETTNIKAAFTNNMFYRLANGYIIDDKGYYFKAVPD